MTIHVTIKNEDSRANAVIEVLSHGTYAFHGDMQAVAALVGSL